MPDPWEEPLRTSENHALCMCAGTPTAGPHLSSVPLPLPLIYRWPPRPSQAVGTYSRRLWLRWWDAGSHVGQRSPGPALQNRPSVWTSSGPGKGLLHVLEKMVSLTQTQGTPMDQAPSSGHKMWGPLHLNFCVPKVRALQATPGQPGVVCEGSTARTSSVPSLIPREWRKAPGSGGGKKPLKGVPRW